MKIPLSLMSESNTQYIIRSSYTESPCFYQFSSFHSVFNHLKRPPIGLRDCVIDLIFLRDFVKTILFLRDSVNRHTCVICENVEKNA